MAIARIWSCRADPKDPDAYPRHFRDKVLPELDTIPGFLGAMLMRRDLDGAIEYTVLTRWVSLDVIRRFTGRDVNAAVVHPDIAVALIDYDQTVTHSEIVEKVWSSR
ncbi:antibiotic biosynthesis monooxygenase family protein [Dongia sedimenti]|uniref:Antibiotic biosynthesis monooxygenase n=1 Tax=Dongia sedimenti TaxID=3064282 RepID=A0ABU0YTE4_9PROT|nr:antibiotic biosynthesis monooxygenase [Rhodospirillaceae bacterium R-7]